MASRYLLGFDVGSSSVKASLTDVDNGEIVASAFYPDHEAPIMAVKTGWAEQDPQMWWDNAKLALKKIMAESGAKGEDILAIGISYQMHGLVCVDKNQQVLRPSIIWCDSRAVPYGEKAFHDLGENFCLRNLLNSPGNFTASKLAWVKDNEPELFDKIDKIMLPGDYLAMKLSGEVKTTISGLSEGMMWDFNQKKPAKFLLDYFGFDESILADIVPTFSVQSVVSKAAAEELGLNIDQEPFASLGNRQFTFYRVPEEAHTIPWSSHVFNICQVEDKLQSLNAKSVAMALDGFDYQIDIDIEAGTRTYYLNGQHICDCTGTPTLQDFKDLFSEERRRYFQRLEQTLRG